MGKYHFLARSLLSARSEPATKIRRVLELRSPSGGRDQQSRLQRSIACIGRAGLPALPLPGCWARRGSQWTNLLLHPLRADGGKNAV